MSKTQVRVIDSVVTFIITHKGAPYHLTPDYEPSYGVYADMLTQYQACDNDFENDFEIEPLPTAPNPIEEQSKAILAQIAQIENTYCTPRTLREAALDNEYAIAKLQTADGQIATLRAALLELQP